MATKKRTRRKAAKKPRRVVKKDPIKEAQALLGKDGIADVLRASDDDVLFHVREFLPTGSLALDRALSFLGYPYGRIVEIAGDEHTGKTTLLDQAIAVAQRKGAYTLLVDTEQGHDVKYLKALGVDLDKLMVMQPKRLTLEGVVQCLVRILNMFETDFPDVERLLVGVDSVAGMPTEADLKSTTDEGKQKPGDAAKQLRNMCRVLSSKIARRNVALLFTNQLYTAFGGSFTYRKSYGGDALPYYASLRIRMKKKEMIKRSGGEIIGQSVVAKFVKSRLFGVPTGLQTTLGIIHGVGVDDTWSIMEEFKAARYIQTSGGWNTMQLPDEDKPRTWQRGHEGLADLCREDPTLMSKLVQIYGAMHA